MASATEAVAHWNPEAVISAAKELIHSSNYEKVGEARQNVDVVVTEWVRMATCDPGIQATASVRQQAERAVVQLWSMYAALEIELRQFKQATRVFENGTNCEIAKTSATFWLQYAAFCVDRQKFSNARKVFVRALRAVPENDHGDLWTQFYAFVAAHLDPSMTLAALQAQVFPGKDFTRPVEVAAASEPTTATTTNDAVEKQATVNEPQAPSQQQTAVASTPSQASAAMAPVTSTVTASPVIAAPPPMASSVPRPSEKAGAPPPVPAPVSPLAVDPSIAFVDKTGDATVGAKRKLSDASQQASGSSPTTHQAKVAKTASAAATTTTSAPATVVAKEDYHCFRQIPTTLPVTPGCPHLLFDTMETQKSIDNELLERLSTVLSDSAVFQGVTELYGNQRDRDREMLYRWQDLVGMQMKEGSELFARHMDIETKTAAETPSELQATKMTHSEQRREFMHRCQMSQHQFIEISEMDRVSALKAQQISLENLKIPEMTVTSDVETIELQRSIVGLVLEADRLSREDKLKKKKVAPVPKRKTTASYVPKTFGARPRSDSRDRDPRDRDSYQAGRGGRGGRGGFSRGGGSSSFGRGGGGFRRPTSPPRSGGDRGPPKRHDGYSSQPGGPPPRTYDHAPPPRQDTPSSYNSQRPRTQASHHSPGRGYGGDYEPRENTRPAPFDRGQDTRYRNGSSPPQEWAGPSAPRRFSDVPPAARRTGVPLNEVRYAPPQDAYGGPSGRGPPPAATAPLGYDLGHHQYGGPPQGESFSGGPPPSRYGGDGERSNRYGGGNDIVPSGPPPSQQQQYAAAPSNSFDFAPQGSVSYGYSSNAPPPPYQQVPQNSAPYGGPPVDVYQQAPLQQQQHHVHHQQQPPLGQQQQRGYGAAPPPQQQQYQPQQQPQQQQQHQQQHAPPRHQPQQHQPFQRSPPRDGGGRGGRGGGRGGYDRFRRDGGGRDGGGRDGGGRGRGGGGRYGRR